MKKIHLILALTLVLFLLPGCGDSELEIEEPEIEVSEADTYQLPDTGQTSGYTSTFGEDSDYTINPPAYSYDRNSEYDTDSVTITDNNTGLIWQRQDDNITRTWADAGTYCDDSTLGSQSDWRLPDKKELASIVNYQKHPAINDAFFEPKYGPSDRYWSSTTDASNTSIAWSVSFYDSAVGTNPKTNSYFVRCVRGQVSASTLEDQGDSTVLDKKTRLVWQQDPTDDTFTWEAAIEYCEGESELGDKNDWRLPNFRELESITDDSTSDPAIDETYFEETNPSYYWSSTTHYGYTDTAWYVHFYNGAVGRMHKTDSYYVRCVRSGQ